MRGRKDNRLGVNKRWIVIWGILSVFPWVFAAPPANYNDPASYPSSWPLDASWISYSFNSSEAEDASGGSGGDGSNGGTNPSGIVDLVAPENEASVFYDRDCDNFYFRLRLDANPLALSGSSQPFGSATWSVLLDVDGDGYKEFVVQVSGIDSNPQPDDIIVFYNNNLTQTVDLVTDILWRQDGAEHPTSETNADGEPGNAGAWDTDGAATVWDYSRTRVVRTTGYDFTGGGGSDQKRYDYFLDLQVPIAALDASALGGPTLDCDSYFAMAYSTANSNSNPTQKDFSFPGDYKFTDPTDPFPFGDPVPPTGDPLDSPLAVSLGIGTCGASVPVIASIIDSIETYGNNQIRSTVRNVEFLYYWDKNTNGLIDDGQSWVSLGTIAMTATATTTTITGGTVANDIGPWQLTWDSTGVLQGEYFIKTIATDVLGNVVDSADTDSNSASYNPLTQGTTPQVVLFDNTACGVTGVDLVISKSVNQVGPEITEQVIYTITVQNDGPASATGVVVTDTLDAGLSFVSSSGCVEDNAAYPQCTLGNIAASASASYSIIVDVLDTGVAGSSDDVGTVLANSVSVVANEFEIDNNTNTNSVNVTVSGLILTKWVCNLSVAGSCSYPADYSDSAMGKPGEVLEYRIEYERFGSDVFDINLSDNLPLNTTLLANQYGMGEISFVCPGAGATPLDLDAVSSNYGTVSNTDPTSNGTTLEVYPTGVDGVASGGVCNLAQFSAGDSGYWLFRVSID